MDGHTVIHGCASDFNHASIQSLRDSIFTSATSSSFLGPRSMVSFQDGSGSKRSERSFFQYDQEENVDEELDEYLRQPEKKRRLTADQVLFLEKSFEVENKLEPDRKVELAKELGLQPRQIAIWFQNRRARWKTKQLEKDYESLLANYDALKSDYDDLLKEKEKLKDEIASINEQLLPKEIGTTSLESSCAENVIAPRSEEPCAEYICDKEASKAGLKTEELSSAKSDVLDSDSPRYNVVHSCLLEPGDSSYVFEHDQSDLSQDEEDNISKNLLRPMYLFTKNEDACYFAPSCSNPFGFPVEDHAFGFW